VCVCVCGDNFVVTEMKYAASNCVSEIMIHLRIIPSSEGSVNMIQNQYAKNNLQAYN